MLLFSSLRTDLRERHTLLTQSIGMAVQLLPFVAANQSIIQRYKCIKEKWKAKL